MYIHAILHHAIPYHAGEEEDIEKYSRRLVKVTPQHNEDCKHLLTLMGIPYVNVST